MISQRSKATAGRIRAADDIHDKIDAAHLLVDLATTASTPLAVAMSA
jgi:hypothetical protein